MAKQKTIESEHGFIEALKLAKRPLEYKLLPKPEVEAILKRRISDMYVDWYFEDDKEYMVLMLESTKNRDGQEKVTLE